MPNNRSQLYNQTPYRLSVTTESNEIHGSALRTTVISPGELKDVYNETILLPGFGLIREYSITITLQDVDTGDRIQNLDILSFKSKVDQSWIAKPDGLYKQKYGGSRNEIDNSGHVTPWPRSEPTIAAVIQALDESKEYILRSKGHPIVQSSMYGDPSDTENDGTLLFESSATKFSAKNALILCRVSTLAYHHGDDDDDLYEKIFAKTENAKAKKIGAKGDECMVISTDNAIIIAPRGSSDDDDKYNEWINNLAWHKGVPWKYGYESGKVHEGFLQSMTDLKSDIDEALSANNQGGNKKIWVTGNSRRGAIATLLAAYLAQSEPASFAGVYTFGAPKVGDEYFSERMDAATKGKYFRFTNQSDIVPTLPWIGDNIIYASCGQQIQLSANGEALAVDTPPIWTWLESAVMREHLVVIHEFFCIGASGYILDGIYEELKKFLKTDSDAKDELWSKIWPILIAGPIGIVSLTLVYCVVRMWDVNDEEQLDSMWITLLPYMVIDHFPGNYLEQVEKSYTNSTLKEI